MAGFLSGLFGGGYEEEAANKNRQQYGDYLTKGTGFLQTGLDNAMGAFDSAKGAYAPLSALGAKYGAGTDMYLNALGLNGASGTRAAQDAFTAGPGYNWQVGQGMDAINRRRAAGGMLNSGNADLDALTYGQGLAKQEYNGWLGNLSGVNNQNASITGAVAGGLAGIDAARAGTYTQNANDLTNLQGSYTSGMAGANTLEAQGKAAGARNLLGLGQSVLGAVAGFGGGGMGSALGGTPGTAIPGAFGATSFGGPNGPMPLTGGSAFGRWFG